MSAKADEKLEQTLRRTSALIRRVEAGAAFLSVAAAALFLLLGGILLDHHFADGLSEKARCLYALDSAGGFSLALLSPGPIPDQSALLGLESRKRSSEP